MAGTLEQHATRQHWADRLGGWWARRDPFTVGALVAFAVVRFWSIIGRPIVEFIDTDGYRDFSLIGRAYRPWGYPLILWLTSGNDSAVMAVQLIAGIAAFGLLAVTVADQMSVLWVRRVVLVAVLLLGVHPRTTAWDLALLTESLTISISCVLLAAWVRSSADRRWAWVFVAAFVFWVFLRDAHVFLAVPVVVAAVVRWRRSLLSLMLVVTITWAGWISVSDQRIETGNALGNIAWHAPEHGTTDWFVDRGMPELELFDDPIAEVRIQAMWADPDARAWIEEKGAGVWAKYLLTHPRALLAPAGDWDSLYNPVRFTDPRDPLSISQRWPGPHHILLLILLTTALLVLLACRSTGRWDRRLNVPTFLLASVVPHHFMVVHAVPIEAPRHGLLMAFTLMLGLIWAAAVSADVLVDGNPAGPDSQTPLVR